jgi:hypothetical protein
MPFQGPGPHILEHFIISTCAVFVATSLSVLVWVLVDRPLHMTLSSMAETWDCVQPVSAPLLAWPAHRFS